MKLQKCSSFCFDAAESKEVELLPMISSAGSWHQKMLSVLKSWWQSVGPRHTQPQWNSPYVTSHHICSYWNQTVIQDLAGIWPKKDFCRALPCKRYLAHSLNSCTLVKAHKKKGYLSFLNEIWRGRTWKSLLPRYKCDSRVHFRSWMVALFCIHDAILFIRLQRRREGVKRRLT